MMHPNIVSVYSISLRPSGPRAPLAAKAGLTSSGGSSGAGGMLLLREDGTVGASELNAGGGPTPSAASLELLPWEMQLIMELCDQVGSVCGGGGGGGVVSGAGSAGGGSAQANHALWAVEHHQPCDQC